MSAPKFVSVSTAIAALALPAMGGSGLDPRPGLQVQVIQALTALDETGGVWTFDEAASVWRPLPIERGPAKPQPRPPGNGNGH